MPYEWWVFIHLLGVFGFLLAHGVSVAVMFRLRKERDRDRIRDLLTLSGSTIVWLYVSIAVLLAGGIGGMLKVGLWPQRWIRISLGLLVGMILAMGGLARPYYQKIKEASTLRPSGVPRVSDEDLTARLRAPQPIVIAVTGFGSLAAILWLMVFKPI